MYSESKKITRSKWLYYFFVANIMIMLFVYVYTMFSVDRNEILSTNRLEKNWTVKIDGKMAKRQPDGKLKSYIFPDLKKGQTISLYKKLEKTDLLKPHIVFDTWNMITHVYLDSIPIYQNGVKYMYKNSMMGGRRHRISLPDDYAGKTLRIDLYAIKDDPMPNTCVGIYDSRDSNLFWFERPFTLIVIGSMIIYMGVIVMILGYKYSKNSLLLGAFFFELGTYILCRAKTIDIIISDPDIYNKVEYMSLYLLPFTVSLYIYEYIMEIKSKKINTFYFCYIIELYIFIATSFTLDLLDVINISNTLLIYFVNVFLLGILLYVFFKNLPDKKESPWIKNYIYASILFITGAFTSIVLYNLRDIPKVNDFLHLWQWYDYIIPVFMIGTVIFILAGMYKFIENLNYAKTKQEFYEYLAHIDGLTELRNRMSFDDEFEKLDTIKKDYFITVFDLNNLKLTNDTLGHISGDNMIKGFAEILKNSATENTYVYRMGGDEFLILSYDVDKKDKILENVKIQTENFNKEKRAVKISYAQGVADKKDADTKKQVLNLADTRMYEDKARIKGEQKSKFSKMMC